MMSTDENCDAMPWHSWMDKNAATTCVTPKMEHTFLALSPKTHKLAFPLKIYFFTPVVFFQLIMFVKNKFLQFLC